MTDPRLCTIQSRNELMEGSIMTHLFIKLPDVFMKEMKGKLKQKCVSTSTGAIKIYLVWAEPKLSQF